MPLEVARAAAVEAHREGRLGGAHPTNIQGVEIARDAGWEILAEHCPRLKAMDVTRFATELAACVNRVQGVVDAVFATKTVEEVTAVR